MNAEAITEALHGRRVGRGWTVRYQSNNDRSPTLSIREGDGGRILIPCFGGCSHWSFDPPSSDCQTTRRVGRLDHGAPNERIHQNWRESAARRLAASISYRKREAEAHSVSHYFQDMVGGGAWSGGKQRANGREPRG